MNISAVFIRRPIGTALLAVGFAIAGMIAYRALPVAPLPNVDIPTIVVFASRPGAEPDTIASALAAPLERQLGAIAGVDEMTSVSAAGAATIVMQFNVNRDLDSAAYDVQAAINAAAPDLPSDMPTRPFFRKFNPADVPILTIALTSDSRPLSEVHDLGENVLAQRLAQVEGVSQVQVNGADIPAVRVRLSPAALAATGLTGRDVDLALRAANAIGPTGGFDGPDSSETLGLNGQLATAEQYRGLVIKSSRGGAVSLGDVASIVDSTANIRLGAWSGDHPAVLLTVLKTNDSNVIDTAERVKAQLPLLRAWIPSDINVTVIADRTATIRASIGDARNTLLLTVPLVLMVMLLFTRRIAPTLAAAATVSLSLAATFGAMWFAGFAVDNFSLMALTISVGFMVDDAIVVIEAIVHRFESGEPAIEAATHGSHQVGFTVVSITLSLVAVFIPMLFMGGIIGRLLHEFATTLTLAITISGVVSLTLTPMLCGHFLRPVAQRRHRWWDRLDTTVEQAFSRTLNLYGHTLNWALRHSTIMIGMTVAAAILTVGLYVIVPKGLLPDEDTGLIEGSTIADPSVSYQAMAERQRAVVDVLLRDPAVEAVGSQIGVINGFTPLNRGGLTVTLKPRAERDASAAQVIARLQPALAQIGGMQTVLDVAQDLHGGSRQGGGIKFVLLAADLSELREWTSRLEQALRRRPGISRVSSDQDESGPEAHIAIDRAAAARLGVSIQMIDDVLDTSFSQHQSAIIYGERSQYQVILEVDPALQSDPSALDQIFLRGSGGSPIPLGSIAHVESHSSPVTVRHQSQIPAATISFDPAPDVSVGTALDLVRQTAADLHMPATIRTEFAGNAKFLEESLSSEPMLIAAALLSIYIVLGMLYESLGQPLTILSTLPSAGLGALVALMVTGTELTVVSIIGIILLMGIAKKNAIMMIDVALEHERTNGLSPAGAIHIACLSRFRPIMMTTFAALLGALPLALASGIGSELRQPLGIAITGGLLVSQTLTLYTTPVIYMALRRRKQSASADTNRVTNTLIHPSSAFQCDAGAPGWRNGSDFAKASTARHAPTIPLITGRSAKSTPNPRAPIA